MSQAIKVSAAEAGKKTSKMINSADCQDTVQLEAENSKCYWNDQEFSKGEQIAIDGKCYECSFGLWTEIS